MYMYMHMYMYIHMYIYCSFNTHFVSFLFIVLELLLHERFKLEKKPLPVWNHGGISQRNHIDRERGREKLFLMLVLICVHLHIPV